MTLSADQRQERLSRPCKRCGKPLSSLTKTQVACTGGCLGWNKTVDVECKVCGVSFEAKEGRLKKYGDLCCSKQCQRQLAVKSRWEDLNRIKSSLAKAKNHKTRSRDRYMKSEFRKWSLVAGRFLSTLRQLSEWKRRCNTAIVCLRSRVQIGLSEREIPKTWHQSIRKQTTRLTQLSRRQSRNGWERRCDSVLSNTRRRLMD